MEEKPPDPGGIGALIAALTAVGYGIVRLVAHVRRVIRKGRVEEAETEMAIKEKQDEREARRRRESSEEAWQVVDRQTTIIDGFQKRFDELEKKCEESLESCESRERACQAELRYQEGLLTALIVWAKSQGMKIPAEIKPGSGAHRPLQDKKVKHDGKPPADPA